MRSNKLIIAAVVILGACAWWAIDSGPESDAGQSFQAVPVATQISDRAGTAAVGNSAKKTDSDKASKMTERAVLAGGCFWGMEDLIRKMPGVISTRVGYTGGNVRNATYRNHGTHAEAIEIVFDPTQTSYRKLLELFFQIHDPTTLNRQGNDRGTSYRSAIYFTSDQQKQVALDTIEDVNASGKWPGKAVTEVEPVSDFWEAEPEHQNYLQRYPNGYTCHFPRPDWVLPSRKEAAAK